MAVQLFARLQALRQRVRRVLWVYGLCWLTVVFVGSAFMAGLLDWLVHLDDSGIRCLLGLCILGATGFIGWRRLIVPLMTQLSDLDLSLRIERLNPGLADSLASTIQFLQSDQDQRLGSPSLQRAVIQRTLSGLNQISIEGIVQTDVVRKIGWVALGVCVFTANVVGWNRADAATAMQRLVFPFGNHPWPRAFELSFVSEELEPMKTADDGKLTIAQGETLKLYVENARGPLPKDLSVEQLRGDGSKTVERMRQTTLRDATGKSREIGTTTLLVSSGPLSISARGGDGATQTLRIEVVAPPKIEALFLTLVPPTYTGLPEKVMPENVGHIEGMLGTKVLLSAKSTKELASATLNFKGGEPIELTLKADARGLHGEFTIEKAGSSNWWLTLQDQQGFENPDAQRYELRGIADLAPEVRITLPQHDLTVTPTAQIAFRVEAKDDLAVKEVRLVQEPLEVEGASAPTFEMQLFGIGNDKTARSKQLILEELLDLGPMKLSPGARVVLHGDARDYYDLGPDQSAVAGQSAIAGQVGVSQPRTLTVVSPDEKRTELSDRQAHLLLELERVQKLETNAREHVQQLQLQIEKAGELRTEDIDLLKRVAQDQRQIASRLTAETDGLEAQARSLQAEREVNDVSDPKAQQLTDSLAQQIDALKKDVLPQLDRELAQALKTNSEVAKGGESAKRKEKTQQALQQTARRQEEVQQTLGKVLGEFQEWRRERNLAGDLREMSADQQKLADDAKQLGQQTVSKPLDSLSGQQKAELSKLAERQQRMAARIEEFKSELDRPKSAKKPEEEPRKVEPGNGKPEDKTDVDKPGSDEAASLEVARQKLKESDLAARMRQAANRLNRNQISDAVKQQEEVIETLRKLQDVFDDRDVTDQETLVKQLGETQDELAGLREEQAEVLRKLDAAAKNPDAAEREPALEQLRKEQQQLRQRAEETLRRLQRLQSQAARRSIERATQRMKQAEADLAQGQPVSAAEQLQESLDDLEQAERELAKDKQQEELKLAQEVIERVADQLKSLRDRQQAARDEAQRLQAEFETAGRWSRTLLKSVRTLAQVQRNLHEETQNAAKNVKSVEVLTIAIDGTARFMDQAATRLELETPDAGPKTLQAQERALHRLNEMLAALGTDPDEKPKPEPGNDPNQKSDDKDSGPPGEAVPLIAQLKVIRTLQTDLNDRVSQLESERPATGEFDEAQQAELSQIADEQSRLADLVRELTEFFGDPPMAEVKPEDPEVKEVGKQP